MALEPPLRLRLDAGLVLVPQEEVRVQLLVPDAARPAMHHRLRGLIGFLNIQKKFKSKRLQCIISVGQCNAMEKACKLRSYASVAILPGDRLDATSLTKLSK